MNKENKIVAGFTIIELIVVIAIIAVLAGVVIINVTKYIQDFKVVAVKANMETIKKTASQMYVDNGSYENLFSDCSSSGCNSSPNTSIRLAMQQIFSLKPSPPNSYNHTFFFDNSNKDKWCGCVNLENPGTNTYCISGDRGSTVTRQLSTYNCYNRCDPTGPSLYSCEEPSF